MIALDPARRRRLIASAQLLNSDKEGERRAALEAVLRLLPNGVTVAGLLEQALRPATVIRPDFRIVRAAQPEPAQVLRSWQRTARDVLARADALSETETDFVQKMASAVREPSPKQLAWLTDLSSRVRRAA
jgi:hypothetical protein